MSKRGTLRGTTVSSFWCLSGGLGFVCVCTCVSDGATHKKAGGSSNQNTQVGRPLSKHYVSGDTTAMKTLTEKKSKKKLSAARVESFSYTGGIALKFVLTYGGIFKRGIPSDEFRAEILQGCDPLSTPSILPDSLSFRIHPTLPPVDYTR